MKSVVLVIVTAAALAVGGSLLVMEKSPSSRVVPDAIGLDATAARSSVRSADLDVRIVPTAATTSDQIGSVIDQVPSPGSDTVVGATVDLVLAERPSPVTVAAQTNIDDPVDFWAVDDMEPGGCYNGRPSGGGLAFDRIDCIEPHDVQLVGIVEIDLNGAFDMARIDDQLASQCSFVHEAFVGSLYEQTGLATFTIRPHRDRWATGERQGHCFVLAPDSGERLVGTAELSLW